MTLDERQAGGMGIQGCLQAYDPSTDTWEGVVPPWSFEHLPCARPGGRPSSMVWGLATLG